MLFIILFIAAYLAGSVNFSILVLKYLGEEDPRTVFSGNAGVSNVFRQAGIIPAAVVLLFDISRAMGIGYVAVTLLPDHFVPWIALGLLVGNRFPLFHGFKGGKGVANYLGFTFIIAPIEAGVSVLLWSFVYLFTKIPFIASFTMLPVLSIGILSACGYHAIQLTGVFITTFFIVYSHKRNIYVFIQQKKDVHSK